MDYMSKRKTIEIERVKKLINEKLKSQGSISERLSLMTLLEIMLSETGNYKGFRYLTVNEVPSDCDPGIIRDIETGLALSFPDTSRVEYY